MWIFSPFFNFFFFFYQPSSRFFHPFGIPFIMSSFIGIFTSLPMTSSIFSPDFAFILQVGDSGDLYYFLSWHYSLQVLPGYLSLPFLSSVNSSSLISTFPLPSQASRLPCKNRDGQACSCQQETNAQQRKISLTSHTSLSSFPDF